MKLKIGKRYRTRGGRVIQIKNGNPPINGSRLGWNGIYWGESIDQHEPSLKSVRFEFNGRHWDYISQFSIGGYSEINNPDLDLVEEIK